MGLQFVVEAGKKDLAADLFGEIWNQIEVFEVDKNYIGISIPRTIVDHFGEDSVNRNLKRLPHYDLWDGKWKVPDN